VVKDTTDYLKSCGVVCYEQDWLDPIYANSPEMASRVGIADAFTDSMAKATRDHGMTMQYCMATPRFFLQGVKYPNLTTIRPSGDRFEPDEWSDFLFGSQFASCVGIWPWCDVFKSSEMGNMILAVLSGGPVGTGDAIGKESRENILKACRADGVIVKPDHPIVPTDQTNLDSAHGSKAPFIASTYTEQAGLRISYLFAFPRPKGVSEFSISLKELGQMGTCNVMDKQTGEVIEVAAGGSFRGVVGPSGYNFSEIAPASKSGIVLVGDAGKIVSTGKQRLEVLRDTPRELVVKLLFAKDEGEVELACLSKHASSAPVMVLRGEALCQGFGLVSRSLPRKREAQ